MTTQLEDVDVTTTESTLEYVTDVTTNLEDHGTETTKSTAGHATDITTDRDDTTTTSTVLPTDHAIGTTTNLVVDTGTTVTKPPTDHATEITIDLDYTGTTTLKPATGHAIETVTNLVDTQSGTTITKPAIDPATEIMTDHDDIGTTTNKLPTDHGTDIITNHVKINQMTSVNHLTEKYVGTKATTQPTDYDAKLTTNPSLSDTINVSMTSPADIGNEMTVQSDDVEKVTLTETQSAKIISDFEAATEILPPDDTIIQTNNLSKCNQNDGKPFFLLNPIWTHPPALICFCLFVCFFFVSNHYVLIDISQNRINNQNIILLCKC